jgi:hypothetical protein
MVGHGVTLSMRRAKGEEKKTGVLRRFLTMSTNGVAWCFGDKQEEETYD